MGDIVLEKRKKVILSPEESRILKWLYIKTLLPMGAAIVISSTVLFLGLRFLMNKVSFTNYGVAPTSAMENVAKFISIYIVIAVSNVVVIIALSAVVMYLVLHDLVLPIIRITREIKESMDTHKKEEIIVRSTDRLLKPLVDLLNKLIA
jgi:hypothetical protein